MSRRMDREGVHRMEPQCIRNRRYWEDPRCKENERGWVEPFAVWQGWEEWNRANHALKRLLIFWKKPRLSGIGQIQGSLQTFNYALYQSKKCDRPKIPG